jgi:endoglucanase
MNLYTTLKQLCAVPALSGREGGICRILKEKIAPYVDNVEADTLGNLIAHKKGRVGERKIMLCAHMDEIGFLVNFIEDNGLIRVAAIGGISFASAAYSGVISENGVRGILVPNDDAKGADVKQDTVYIDIGAKSKRDAERRVRIGDAFVGVGEIHRLGSKRVAGRPLDDRVGCLVLLAIAERLAEVELDADVYFVFSVQEEVGCRGSKTATYAIRPTEAICFDVTRTGDVPGAKAMACALGKGAAIKIKDSSVICHEEIVNELRALSKEYGIPAQTEVLTAGGTDTSSMQLTAGGAMVGAISIPTRYIHTSVECCDMGDVEACVDLGEKYVLKRG